MPPEPSDTAAAGQVRRAWNDLLAALGRAGYAAGELIRPPAAAQEVAAAEALAGRRFPPELAALYRLSDSFDSAIEVRGGDPVRALYTSAG